MSGLFSRFRTGLSRTTRILNLKSLFKGARLDDDLLDELEERLLRADLGPSLVLEFIDELRESCKEGSLKSAEDIQHFLHKKLTDCLTLPPKPMATSQKSPAVWLFLGVNGVGKTTTIAKVAKRLSENRFSVLLAAGDTFRAAAAEQLQHWAKLAGTEMVAHKSGGDPSAVVFDAVEACQARKTDYLLVDTAGRLHNKKNLMEELEKMCRVVRNKTGENPEEVFLVLDATTGQNAFQQAKVFAEVAPLTGLILTKLDGSAKGGVVFGLVRSTGVPVRFVGLGEKLDDLVDFEPEAFIRAVLEEPED